MIKVSSHCIADFSGMDKFVKQAIKLSQQEVDIGFNQETHEDSGLTYADLANILNSGADSVNIPPRVFMESAMDQFEVDNLKVTPLAVKRILYKDMPMEAELLKIGRKQKQILKQVMELKLFPFPNNAASTIAKKDRDDALIDKGDLIKNIEVSVGKYQGVKD